MSMQKTLGWVAALLAATGGGCLKVKHSIENATLEMPEVRFQVIEGYVGPMKHPSEIQIDVYGAGLGAEVRLVGPDERSHSLQCVVSDMGHQEKRHQLWTCIPRTNLEGTYRLEVEARGKHGSTVKHFVWSYEKMLLLVQMHLQEEYPCWQDDTLYVQLEGSEDVDWAHSKLSVGKDKQHRATRTTCPERLPVKAHSQCFKVLLSELPNLQAGFYVLHLTAELSNGSYTKSHTRSSEVRIGPKCVEVTSN